MSDQYQQELIDVTDKSEGTVKRIKNQVEKILGVKQDEAKLADQHFFSKTGTSNVANMAQIYDGCKGALPDLRTLNETLNQKVDLATKIGMGLRSSGLTDEEVLVEHECAR